MRAHVYLFLFQDCCKPHSSRNVSKDVPPEIIQSSPSHTQKHTQLRRTHGFSASQGFSSLSSFPSTFSAFLFDGLATVPHLKKPTQRELCCFKTKLFLQLMYSIYWLLPMKGKKLKKSMNWTKWFIADFLHTEMKDLDDSGYSHQLSFATFPGPPAPCLEDVAGVACCTGAGAASSTSPWDSNKTMQQQQALSSPW